MVGALRRHLGFVSDSVAVLGVYFPFRAYEVQESFPGVGKRLPVTSPPTVLSVSSKVKYFTSIHNPLIDLLIKRSPKRDLVDSRIRTLLDPSEM